MKEETKHSIELIVIGIVAMILSGLIGISLGGSLGILLSAVLSAGGILCFLGGLIQLIVRAFRKKK